MSFLCGLLAPFAILHAFPLNCVCTRVYSYVMALYWITFLDTPFIYSDILFIF